MFSTAHRGSLMDSDPAVPSVGTYTLRPASAPPRPHLAPFGAGSRRSDFVAPQPVPPTQYLGHTHFEPGVRGVKFNAAPRFRLPEDSVGVGAYDLLGVTAMRIIPPRPPPAAHIQAAAAERKRRPARPPPPSIPTAREEGGYLEEAPGQWRPLPREVPPEWEAQAATADLRQPAPRIPGVPISTVRRFGVRRDGTTPEDGEGPGVGAYTLDVRPRSTRQGVSFAASGSPSGGAMGRPTTAPTVGPGSYDLDGPHGGMARRGGRVLPADKQCFGDATPRDPLGMTRAAADARPGPADYDIGGHDLAREARLARERDELHIAVGTARAERTSSRRAAPMSATFGGHPMTAEVANGVTPRGPPDERPCKPAPSGVHIPAFGYSALRPGLALGNEGPGPADYFGDDNNAERRARARVGGRNTGFSTGRRFLPAPEDVAHMQAPPVGEYDVDVPAEPRGAVPFASGDRSRSPSPTRKQLEEEEERAKPLPEWHMAADLSLPLARKSFNTVAKKGRFMALKVPRSDLVGKERRGNPGVGEYNLRGR
jgi:hypothetical protein